MPYLTEPTELSFNLITNVIYVKGTQTNQVYYKSNNVIISKQLTIPDVIKPQILDIIKPKIPDIVKPKPPDILKPELPDILKPELPNILDVEIPILLKPAILNILKPIFIKILKPVSKTTLDAGGIETAWCVYKENLYDTNECLTIEKKVFYNSLIPGIKYETGETRNDNYSDGLCDVVGLQTCSIVD